MKVNEIEARKAQLNHFVSMKKKALRSAPEGYLRITTSHGRSQFYHMSTAHQSGQVYLPKKDLKLAGQLAQKGYDQKVLRAAEQELKAWTMLARFFPKYTVEEVYDTLSPARQKLVTPIRPTDEEFQAQWESVVYEPGYFRNDSAFFMTDRGERVRSKSEQLIANLLYRLGIPYRYEYPVTLNVEGKTRVWRPDFMILDVKNRKEYYLEHFGMLDDMSEDNYARSAFFKMKVYERNGIYEGKNMIYSFETSRAPLDISYLEAKLRRTLGL